MARVELVIRFNKAAVAGGCLWLDFPDKPGGKAHQFPFIV